MKPNEGRLQTAEHILSRTLEKRLSDAKFIIAKFEENSGRMEIATKEDLRKINRTTLQEDVNSVIKKNLRVSKYIVKRKDAEKEFDLTRLPSSIEEVRIVEIEGFDKTPCKDPHVEHTGEIGYFAILKVERVGKDRYRFGFEVK
jgi:misacylated tRNA(Ala) deacylase